MKVNFMVIYIQPFFDWLLETTLIASVVICLILAIQKTLGGRLGPRWCHALWLVLLIRMVLPWAPSSRLSLFNLIPSWDRQAQHRPQSQIAEQPWPSEASQTSGTAEAIPARKPKPDVVMQEQTTARPATFTDSQSALKQYLTSLRQVLPALWLLGAIVIGAYVLVSDLALWRIVKRDRPLLNQAMLELFEECKAQMGVQTLVAIVPSSQIKSPGLFGFIRPRLLLPPEMIETATRDEMRYVFLHELAHLKRHDIYLGWLTSLLQVLHWFNPLVWLAFYRMRADRELACDALVLARTGEGESQQYGQTIVGLLRRFSRCRPLPAMAGIIEDKSQLKRRIAMITQFKNNSYRWSPAAVLLIIALACLALPDARQNAATAGEKSAGLTATASAQRPTFRKIRISGEIWPDVQLSPDGKNIASWLEDKLWIIPQVSKLGPDYPGASRLLNTGEIKVSLRGFTWSGDGQWIAFTEWDYTYALRHQGNQRMYVISVEGGKPKEVCESNHSDGSAITYRMSLSPNGKTLAFSSVDANEVHIYTISVDGGVPKRLVDAPAREPVFSPDGKRIAYAAGKLLEPQGGLWVVPAEGGTPRLVADAWFATSPVWSPDGRIIAFLDYKDYKATRQIYIVPIDEDGEHAGEKATFDCPEGIEAVGRLSAWTTDNKIGAIFYGPEEYELYTLPAKGGSATLVAHGEWLGEPRWSPDGKRIICTNSVGKGRDDWMQYGIASVPVEGGEIATIPIQSDAKIAKPEFGGGNHVSPDGKTIVFAGKKARGISSIGHIWTLPIEGGEPKQLTNAPAPLTDWYPCWSPDGKAIAFIRSEVAENNFKSLVDANIFIIPADGGEPKQLTRESDRVEFGFIAWSPDGKLLAYLSEDKEGSLKVIPAEGGEPRVVGKLRAFHPNTEMAWSPDSKRIAFNYGDDRVIRVMSLDDGSTLDIDLHLGNTSIDDLDWSRDGSQLVFTGSQGGDPEFWLVENFLPEGMGK